MARLGIERRYYSINTTYTFRRVDGRTQLLSPSGVLVSSSVWGGASFTFTCCFHTLCLCFSSTECIPRSFNEPTFCELVVLPVSKATRWQARHREQTAILGMIYRLFTFRHPGTRTSPCCQEFLEIAFLLPEWSWLSTQQGTGYRIVVVLGDLL